MHKEISASRSMTKAALEMQSPLARALAACIVTSKAKPTTMEKEYTCPYQAAFILL
jgi:hypothetical protein